MSRKGTNIYKRKDGRWEARYVKAIEVNGKKKYGSVYGATYTEARDKQLLLISGSVPHKRTKTSITLSAVMSEWLISIESTVKKSTYQKYLSIMQNHVDKTPLGGLPVKFITSRNISEFSKAKINSGKLSEKTVNDILGIISLALNYAEEIYGLKKPKINHIKEPVKTMRVLSSIEQAKLEHCLFHDMTLYKFGVILALYTGIRVGELCALDWSDIHNDSIIISKTMQAGIISIFLAMLVIACSLTAVIPISAESNLFQNTWIRGDTDGDGVITILDATVIQRYLADYEVKNPERVVMCGDINGDGVNIMDATTIQRYLADFTDPYPIGTPIEQSSESPTEQPTEEITDPSFIVETVNANAGDQNVAVNVVVKNNPGVAAIALDINYDKEKLELTGFSYNTSALGGASTTPYSSTARIPCLFMVNGTANVTGDFTFATLNFNVKASASGICPITISYDEDNVYNIAEENVAFGIVNGAIVLGGSEATDPVPAGSHTVVFKDEDGKVIFRQTVRDILISARRS